MERLSKRFRDLFKWVHTFNWDLKTGVTTTIMSGSSRSKSLNFNIKPGKYTLELYKSYSELTLISEPVTLAIEKLAGHTQKPNG